MWLYYTQMPVSYSDKERELYSIVLINYYIAQLQILIQIYIEHYSKSEIMIRNLLNSVRDTTRTPAIIFLGNICMIEIANILIKSLKEKAFLCR